MGRFVFKLPDVGEGVTEAEIVKWHAALGDAVREEQPLVDIMTDKATVELAAPVSGRLQWRQGEEGDKAAVGSELAIFEVEGDAGAAPAETARGEPVAPVAARVAAAAPGVDEARPSGKALAAPAVRARARALGLELAKIVGTGPDGRVEHADLDAILRNAAPAAPQAAKPAIGAMEDGAEDVKVFGLRRRIAERMQDATRRIPHFTYVEEIDVTDLEALRAQANAGRAPDARLTLLPFLIRAIALSLPAHPGVNAHYDDEESFVRRFKALHVGVATQTKRGLLVPAIRHAERMDLATLAAEIARLSAAARNGKATREELTGSTLTVSSLGALGGVAATPIVNPPEVAIVGVNRVAQRPVVRDGAIAIRKMMNLSSSFDHRIVDGHDAAAFIAEVKRRLEAPAALADAAAS